MASAERDTTPGSLLTERIEIRAGEEVERDGVPDFGQGHSWK